MKRFANLIIPLLVMLAPSPYLQASTLNLLQVLQRVIDQYPTVETALLQVKRARLSAAKSQSLLGWQLQGQAGIQRDASSFFGTALDTASINATLARKLDTGGQIGVTAGVNRQKSKDSLSVVPNPATSTALDFSYRHPLGKGADNPQYTEAAKQAKLDEALALAQRTALYDQLAKQVIELYISTVNTQIRQDNVRKTVERSLRRQKYLRNRTDLGVAEEKDLLQVDAQIKSQRAELKALDVLWQNQRIQLNRLMGRDADAVLSLALPAPDKATLQSSDRHALEQKVIARHAELATIETRLQLADSQIQLKRNEQKDLLDLVMFVGNRTLKGDVIGGSTNESEIVGGVRLEYQQQFDKHAVDADLEQAIIDRDLALVEKKQLLQDIHYDVEALLAQLQTGKQAWRAYLESVKSEQRKLQEAEQRYRTGRSDTDQLIAFEAQLAAAELAAELHKLELLKNDYSLRLLTGDLWQNIKLPDEDTLQ